MAVVRRSLCCVLVLVGAMVGAIQFGATAASDGQTFSAQAATEQDWEFFAKVNQARAEAGLGPLAMSVTLRDLAQVHSQRMAADGAIFHRSPLDAGVPDSWLRIGENVGRGGGVQSLHDAFMASPVHRANLLNPAYNFVGLAVQDSGGTLYVTQIFMQAAPGSTPTMSPPAPLPIESFEPAIPTERKAGGDRFETAAAISQSSFPGGADTVFLATAVNFPDALAAGPAAAQERGPVLLASREVLPEPTAAELRRLSPREVVVVGGASAVSDSVLRAIEAATGAQVRRLSGVSRFDTAAQLSRSFGEGVGTVYVATGRSFPDALAGGAAAAHKGSPILLSERESLPEATEAALRDLRPSEIVVLGGENAISRGVLDTLGGLAPSVRRIAGGDRFSTASAIAEDAFSGALDTAFVATGGNFPDALAGAAAAGLAGAPLVLTQRDCVPPEVRALIKEMDPERLVLLGGQSALGDAVAALASC